MLVVAGPIDFSWHSAFGLDGLLSPPHFVLLMGMIISSLGSMLGIILSINIANIFGSNNKVHHDLAIVRLKPISYISIILTILGVMPIWMSLDGLIGI